MNKQFTASEVRERERFEEWYTTHACNYSRDPIGSRDCSLQWESWKAALAAHSAQAQPPAVSVPDIDVMVTRFLGWRLPQDFAPDAGISFKPMPDIYMPHCWPTGTNLFHAGQAKEMILHMLGAQESPNG